MDPKNKTLIPLIIIFFIIAIAACVTQNPPPTPTPTLVPTATPTPTPTPTPTATPIPVSDFVVKESYDPSTDIPDAFMTIEGYNTVDPRGLSIQSGQSVVIKVTTQSLSKPIWLILYDTTNCSPCIPPYQKYLGSQNGGVFITFNNKGTYNFRTEIRSSDPTILPSPVTTNTTITVY